MSDDKTEFGPTPGKPIANWRKRQRRTKLDDAAKERFLKNYGEHFQRGKAADAAGVCLQTVANHEKNDPEFAAAIEACRQAYADRVEAQMAKVAIEGIDEPIIGGKDRDKIVGHKKVIATNILAMMAKRANPEYKEKSELDLNHNGGGVLVVPSRTSSEAEVAKAFEEFAKDHPTEPGK